METSCSQYSAIILHTPALSEIHDMLSFFITSLWQESPISWVCKLTYFLLLSLILILSIFCLNNSTVVIFWLCSIHMYVFILCIWKNTYIESQENYMKADIKITFSGMCTSYKSPILICLWFIFYSKTLWNNFSQ